MYRQAGLLFFLLALTAPAHSLMAEQPSETDGRIRLNTIGFLPDQAKRASIAAAAERFRVVRAADGRVVHKGTTSGPVANEDTAEELFIADFTAVREPGEYRLEVDGVGVSPAFRIGRDVYDRPFYAATRAMYLWRCGTAVRGEHNGDVFSQEACHLEDGWLDYVTGEHVRKDGVGGWHDAGDYNKYVVNAAITVANMLHAWEHFGDKLRDVRLDLPESGNGTPDLLNEARWEIEWFLKMQAEDGRVYHKLSTLRFGGFIMPAEETAERYFTPWSSAATADFAAITAMAGRIFEPFDPAFAKRCLDAAHKSYDFLAAHPEEHKADLTGFHTGGYQSGDADDRLWAAAEMWQTTGAQTYLKDFESRAGALEKKVDLRWDWGNVGNLGMTTYVLSQRKGRDLELVEAVRREFLRVADETVADRDRHGYARPLGERYNWGCNGTVARQTVVLQVANRIAPNREYVQTALDALGHLFGRNVHGRSYVTGLGHNPPMRPHDRRSGGDDVDAPWPGYLVGGGWPKPTDWLDEEKSFQTNEIAINWNGALIYALAWFVEAGE